MIRMKLRRILAGVVAMAMTVSMMSSLVLADEADSAPEETAAAETAEPKEKEEKKPAAKETEKPAEKKPAETKAAEPEEKKQEETKAAEPSESEEKEPAETKTEEPSEPAQTEPAETEDKEPEQTEPEESSEPVTGEAETSDGEVPTEEDSRDSKVAHSGAYGKLNWSLTDTGVLTISPAKKNSKAAMPVSTSTNPYPWASYKSEISKIVIAKGVTSISDRAFYYCTNLTSATIAGTVSVIGTCAFQECIALKTVSIGSGVKTIGEGAFNGCEHLTSIVIPKTVTTIGNYAFEECADLKTVYTLLCLNEDRYSENSNQDWSKRIFVLYRPCKCYDQGRQRNRKRGFF